MTKAEPISCLAQATPRLCHEDVERTLNSILDEITAALCRGDRVELHGFGTFTVKKWEARTGRNPRAGESVSDRKSVAEILASAIHSAPDVEPAPRHFGL